MIVLANQRLVPCQVRLGHRPMPLRATCQVQRQRRTQVAVVCRRTGRLLLLLLHTRGTVAQSSSMPTRGPSASMPTRDMSTSTPSRSIHTSMPTTGPTGWPIGRPVSTQPPTTHPSATITDGPTVTNLTRVFNSSTDRVHTLTPFSTNITRHRHPLVVLFILCVGWSTLSILMIFGGLYNNRQGRRYAYSHV